MKHDPLLLQLTTVGVVWFVRSLAAAGETINASDAMLTSSSGLRAPSITSVSMIMARNQGRAKIS